MEQKIVVHTKEGKIFKGVTQDFEPERESFHFLPHEGGGVPVRFRVDELKALFWVRDYLGNRHFVPRRNFERMGDGHRAIARFEDGEEIWGTLDAEPPGEERGFFLTPADREDNNIRIYVVRSALKELKLM
jgi:hypothetical protein